MRFRNLALVLCFLAAACGRPGPLGPIQTASGPTSQVRVMNASELPPPGGNDLVSQSRPYLIGPFDTLMIDVFGIEELSRREVRADAAGRISFPLVGAVDALGKTPAELEAELVSRLRSSHVRDPRVTVNLREAVSQVVTVDGQVRQPGVFPVVGRMTLMQAVARASGLGEYARLDDVIVFRTVNGQRMAALYNLGAIRRGNYDDPEIFANDIVIVGDNPARRIFRDLLQVAPLLSSPLVVALQSGN